MSITDTNSPRPKNDGFGKDSLSKDSLAKKAEGVVDQARAFGRDLQGQASELTQSAAETVKTQAANLKEQAKDVASDAGEKLRTSMNEQKAAGADYVGNIANIIRRTAYEFDADIPQAGQYIRKAAAQLETVSEAMRNKNMSEIVGNVQDFARKQPTAFFGAAVFLGFAAVRFLKSGSGAAANTSMRFAGESNSGGGRTSGMGNIGGRTSGMANAGGRTAAMANNGGKTAGM